MSGLAALVFAPQLGAWIYYFGSLRPPQPHGHMRWWDPAIVASITAWLHDQDVLVQELRAGRGSLEDVFLRLTTEES